MENVWIIIMDFLPSLSLIVTVVVLGLPKVTSDGVPATRANMTLKLSVGSALRQSSTIGNHDVESYSIGSYCDRLVSGSCEICLSCGQQTRSE